MFGDVWTWAGSYRPLETSIGIDPAQIAGCIRHHVAAVGTWAGHEPPLCVAVRFHHRLVSILPFPNDNGRHGRQAADYLMEALEQPPITWGRLRVRVTSRELGGDTLPPSGSRTMGISSRSSISW